MFKTVTRAANLKSPRSPSIRPEIEDRVLRIATRGRDAVDRRIKELEEEWDVESLLKLHALTTGGKYVLMGALVSKKYYLVPALFGVFALEQALQHWSPPYAAFRKLGNRPAEDIEEERFALKYLRGDYDNA